LPIGFVAMPKFGFGKKGKDATKSETGISDGPFAMPPVRCVKCVRGQSALFVNLQVFSQIWIFDLPFKAN
jgi:hypothetical protein